MHLAKPTIYNYQSIPSFLHDRLQWLKQINPEFSIKEKCASLNGCSQTLATLVIHGKRRLTRDKVANFSYLLELSNTERNFLDQWVSQKFRPVVEADKLKNELTPKNHILNHWLNLYVKDCVQLEEFDGDPKTIFRLLHGLASELQIQNSLEQLKFLGFLRKNIHGELILDENIVKSTNEIPNKKIKNFHKKALEIAKNALDKYSIEKRKSYFISAALNEEELEELNDIIREFYEKIGTFLKNKKDPQQKRKALYQIIINLSPIGGKIE